MSFVSRSLRSRAAFLAVLLLFMIFALASCDSTPVATKAPGAGGDASHHAAGGGRGDSGSVRGGDKEARTGDALKASPGSVTVKAADPSRVLSRKKLPDGLPSYRGWNEKGSGGSSRKMISVGTSAGAIPAVRPFNFGRDPGGPKDKKLYLSIPKIGLQDVPVYNSVDSAKLDEGAVHVPATGFPWQKGANVYIAGHRLGYPNTGSLYLFYHLPELTEGDEVILKDSAGQEYTYRVINKETVGPENVQVMNPVPGKSLVTLQTCTLPHYTKRIIVQAELVGRSRE
ncbi:class E sortase [Rubrobacter calidifluminis]|uniref:class E sortase n=1 Tax=Rubrobacter calidifluminis TaxID=1392640 RepID=UPI00235F059C|nr:class E sortase [Rubrobacter calidifluminis]